LNLTFPFAGQGHFYYVSPQGDRGCAPGGPYCYFDYGLDTGSYTANLPEFGFNKHFMQFIPSIVANFTDLFQAQDVFLNAIAMGQIIQGVLPNDLVSGWVAFATAGEIVALSWVKVEATNGTFTRSVPTLDGRYDGVGALNLPAGTYDITFFVVFYESQDVSNFGVYWNATYPLLPPLGPLCPTADPAICPVGAPSFSSQAADSNYGHNAGFGLSTFTLTVPTRCSPKTGGWYL